MLLKFLTIFMYKMDIGLFTIIFLSLVRFANAASSGIKKPIVNSGPPKPLENVSCYTCTVRLKNSMVYEGHKDCLRIDRNKTSIEAMPCLAGYCSIMEITLGDVRTVSRQCLPHCKRRDNTDLEGGYTSVVQCCQTHLCNSAKSISFGLFTIMFVSLAIFL